MQVARADRRQRSGVFRLSAPKIHTVYTVTVKHPEAAELQRYVIAAPTAQHAVTAVERSTGARAYVWQVEAPVNPSEYRIESSRRANG